MLNQQQESISNGFSSLTAEVITDVLLESSKKQPIFVICDACYWCATYFSNARIPTDNICPQCDANSNQLTSIPIAQNESFTRKKYLKPEKTADLTMILQYGKFSFIHFCDTICSKQYIEIINKNTVYE